MKPLRTLGTLAVTAAAALGMAASASAADPTGDLAVFKHCPYTNPGVTQCLYSTTSGGSIKLGNSNVPINKNLILQGGFFFDGSATSNFFNAVGAPTLTAPPLKVPGGLISTVSSNWFFGPLLDAFNWAIGFANDVDAKAELVGPVGFSYDNYLGAAGTAVELPLRIKLENPFLGNSCYIGSASSPVRLKLSTGTSGALTGNAGELGFNDDYTLINLTGNSLVDGTFTAPAAANCGSTILDRWLVTMAVNAKVGLPAASGVSRATFNGNIKLSGVENVQASAGL